MLPVVLLAARQLAGSGHKNLLNLQVTGIGIQIQIFLCTPLVKLHHLVPETVDVDSCGGGCLAAADVLGVNDEDFEDIASYWKI